MFQKNVPPRLVVANEGRKSVNHGLNLLDFVLDRLLYLGFANNFAFLLTLFTFL